MPFEKNDTRINRNGRPKGSQNKMNDYKKALREAIDETDILNVVETLKHKAKHEQCLTSIKLLLEYSVGKPTAHQVNHNYDYSNGEGMNFNQLIKSIKNEK